MRFAAAVALAALLLAAPPGEGPAEPAVGRAERLERHRNLGKAFYENPATQHQAVDELAAALALAPDSPRDRLNLGLALLRAGKSAGGVAELERAQAADPSLAHTWFNLGIAHKRDGRNDAAIAQLRGFLERVPEEASGWYNLGVVLNLTGEKAEAIAAFERAAILDPDLAGPHYQLATALRQAGKADEATAEMARFRELKERQAGAAVPEDLEWSWYSELLDPVTAPVRIPPPGPLRLEPATVAEGLDPATAGLLVLDADGRGDLDVVAWSSRGVRLLAGGETAAADGLAGLVGVGAVAAGDADGDGRADLAVATQGVVLLLRNEGGRFGAATELASGAFGGLLWHDFDHDGDADLLLLGAGSRLLRNEGAAGFAERPFPFLDGEAIAAARLDVESDSPAADLVVAYRDRAGVLYRDRLLGRFDPVPLAALPAGATALAAADLDRDGHLDLAAATAGGPRVLRGDGRGGFVASSAPGGGGAGLALADFESRGVLDLVAGGGLFRRTADAAVLAFAARTELDSAELAAVAVVGEDLDGDGRVDLVGVDAEGRVVLRRNRTPGGHWLRVALTGVKNARLAPGAEVEVKAGGHYQRKSYRGVPLHFGLGEVATIDTVRITWPNGLVQNETRVAVDQTLEVEEAQRLSGSCPMVFTWDGGGWRFITDVLGVAPLGASAGDGSYFPVDHDEGVWIPGEALAPRDGAYEVRLTEELREVTYLDQARLVAVDHRADVEVFSNEKFQGPPFPEPRLFGVSRRIPPRSARDDAGRDVLDRVLRRDATYPDGFARTMDGVAAMHALELDFGDVAPGGDAILVLSGWVDWADGSTFLAEAQAGGAGLVMPYLQLRDRAGEWQTVLEDMGIPAGKPKTIVVDLAGKWLSPSRQARIVTNLAVYWDEVFLAEGSAPPEATLREVPPLAAELAFRGFSRVVVHPERLQPERFVYADVRPTTMWNPTPGLYTRYGDVAPLVAEVDDRLVVMGSGEELRLRFRADLEPPPPGRRRDFLLWVDGWAKDGDPNTAFSQTVEPLPFHAMSAYPYPEGEAFPDGEAHRRWREETLTRPALRLLRPLAPAPAAPAPAAVVAAAAVGATRPALPSEPPPSLPFTDVTAEAGIDFVHVTGGTGKKLLPETMGGGVAFFDYDGDGDSDLLFVGGAAWPGDPVPPARSSLALYRNDGPFRFTDVTREAGLEVALYGMGVAVADVDGDLRRDLFVTAVGGNRLFRNGGGRFEDVTRRAGVGGREDGWSTGAAFFDADGDRDLDLFVADYVEWSPAIDAALDFRIAGVGRAFAPPQSYGGTLPSYFRNDGDFRFSERSREAGVEIVDAAGAPVAKALTVLPLDADRDGRIDVFVANDTVRNFFFRNLGGGRFAEEAELSGLAYDPDGNATGAMGVDAGDVRNDGELAIAIGNFAGEASSLYLTQGDPSFFVDESLGAGIGGPSRSRLTFGVLLIDVDLDGRLDFFEANGHVEDAIARIDTHQSHRQPAQLFWNTGARPTFLELPAAATGALARPLVGRGAACADLDGDGDLDLVVTQVGGPPLLLRNDQSTGHHWLRLRLRDRPPNVDALGARVELTAGGVTQTRVVMPTRSYLSQVEPVLTFGLGRATRVERVRVVWPDGEAEELGEVAVDTLREVARRAGAPRHRP